MQLKATVYTSRIPEGVGRYGPRFANSAQIQHQLVKICKSWAKYIQNYLDRTEKLFGDPEIPWKNTERAIVSTLAASITRTFKASLVIEESLVVKPGANTVSAAVKKTDVGRCDLWASIPAISADGPFSFYLEAKRFQKDQNVSSFKDHLLSRYGISRLFRDFMKSNPGTLDQRSPYQKERKHEHYVIGLIVTPLKCSASDAHEIKGYLKEIFEQRHELDLWSKKTDESKSQPRRHMRRFPTVALVLASDDDERFGMVASFTVLGATRGLNRGKLAGIGAKLSG